MSNDNFSVAPRLYDVEDAAKLCGAVSPWTIRKHISNGSIRVTRIGRRVFLPSEEIERIRREGLPSLGTVRQTSPVVRGQEFSATESK